MDPYVYPGTNVLRNLRDIRDPEQLDRFEAIATARRLAELGCEPIGNTFDAIHLRAIHRYIFQDVYAWAGEIRTVEIAKPSALFALKQHIVTALDKTFGDLAKEHQLAELELAEFCSRAAYYLGEINAIHPFREGNGRAQREFIRQLSVHNGYDLDWTKVTRQQMMEASRESFRASCEGLERILRAAIERNE
jgi:cell filamentation protein